MERCIEIAADSCKGRRARLLAAMSSVSIQDLRIECHLSGREILPAVHDHAPPAPPLIKMIRQVKTTCWTVASTSAPSPVPQARQKAGGDRRQKILWFGSPNCECDDRHRSAGTLRLEGSEKSESSWVPAARSLGPDCDPTRDIFTVCFTLHAPDPRETACPGCVRHFCYGPRLTLENLSALSALQANDLFRLLVLAALAEAED